MASSPPGRRDDPPSSTRDSKRCGPHAELASTPGARVTRCPCGVVHVHLRSNGVTMRLSDEQLRHVANALGAAARLLDHTENTVEAPTREGPLN